MDFEKEARAYFSHHYTCSQSVFAPFAKHLGMDLETALKIATPLGGGMGHNGQVCGAVSGALMAIGLAEGISEYERTQKYACYALAKTFQERFVERYGTLTCPGLLGLDIGDPIDLEEAYARDVFKTVCPEFVGDAARIVSELLGMAD